MQRERERSEKEKSDICQNLHFMFLKISTWAMDAAKYVHLEEPYLLVMPSLSSNCYHFYLDKKQNLGRFCLKCPNCLSIF